MFTYDIYRGVLQNFYVSNTSFHLVIWLLQLILLLFAIKQQKKNYLKGFMFLHAAEWLILAGLFYPGHFSSIAWYWHVLSGGAFLQACAVLYFTNRVCPVKLNYVIGSIVVILAILPFRALVVSHLSDGSWFFVEWGAFRLTLITGIFSLIAQAPLGLRASTLALSLIIFLHEILLLSK